MGRGSIKRRKGPRSISKGYQGPDHIIELKHLKKYFGQGNTEVRAVDDVFLHVDKGEVVLIMGPSGAGKTTLIQLIGALMRPTSGEIIINGKDISKLGQNELSTIRREMFGFIFQNANLFSALTALQNVEIALNLAGVKGKEAKDISKRILKRLGLGERLHHKPGQLSGGEKQRVAIARALSNDPTVLLADEPTASLDSKTGAKAIKLLRRIAKKEGRTILIVSHDLRIRYFADRILWLEDGKLRTRWSENVTVDPVCLMVVNSASVEFTADHGGKSFHFCSRECLKEFKKGPENFIRSP